MKGDGLRLWVEDEKDEGVPLSERKKERVGEYHV